MKTSHLVLFIAVFMCLSFRAIPQLESVVRNYTQAKLGRLESFELITTDTLTDKLRLQLHQSRITDSLVILKPVLTKYQELVAKALQSQKKWPKEPSFVKSAQDANKRLLELKAQLSGMIARSNDLDRLIAQADSSRFRGYLAQAAVKYYEGGNRALTVFDTATVALAPDLSIIEKQDW